MRNVWRSGNLVALLPEGKRYVPAMLEAIDAAHDSILFEQYLIESGQLADRFIDSLVRVSQRGVRVQVLLDAYGAKGLRQHDRKRLIQAGVSLRLFNSFSPLRLLGNLMRDHRKLVLIDGQVAFTGGYCVTDEFLERWYDLAIRVEGPVVADWAALFQRLWVSPRVRGHPLPTSVTPQELASSGEWRPVRARVMWGRGYRYQAIRFSLQQRIETAERRVWLCTPYFLPTPSLLNRLRIAARLGIDVRLLVAGKDHDHPSTYRAAQHTYTPLLRDGVRIYEYRAKFTHAKFCVVDDWSTIGSCNFDHWSLRWNLEANQEVENADFAEQVAALYEGKLADSERILPEQWMRRSWSQRCRERVTGKVNAWLTLLR